MANKAAKVRSLFLFEGKSEYGKGIRGMSWKAPDKALSIYLSLARQRPCLIKGSRSESKFLQGPKEHLQIHLMMKMSRRWMPIASPVDDGQKIKL